MGELIPLDIRSSIELAFDKKLEGMAELAQYITLLINDDFNGLVNILYRLDISEANLRQSLREKPDHDAGRMIAELIIERQMQKLERRNSYKKDENIPEDERW